MRAAEREPPGQPEIATVSGRAWEPEITNTTEDGALAAPDVLARAEDEVQDRPAWRVRADRDCDWYAVVDELIDDVAVLVVSPWPEVDRRATPVFEEEDDETTRTVAELHEVVDEHRERLGQVIRPIRIGDAFLIRAPEAGESPGDPNSWDLVVDVTDAARDQAKVAYYGAVGHAEVDGSAVPAVPPAAAEPEGSALVEEEQSPAGPDVAPPAV